MLPEPGHLGNVVEQLVPVLPEDIYEGEDHEVLPEPGHLGNVVEQAEHLGLYGRLGRELVEDREEQLHASLVKEHLTTASDIIIIPYIL